MELRKGLERGRKYGIGAGGCEDGRRGQVLWKREIVEGSGEDWNLGEQSGGDDENYMVTQKVEERQRGENKNKKRC